MGRIAYVNGAYVPHKDAAVHIEDRGFQFADAIYEVIGCIGGNLIDARGHLDRLERSLTELSIDMPVSRGALSFILQHIIRVNGYQDAALYIQVSRGVAKRDFKFPASDISPSLVVYGWHFNFQVTPENIKGVRVKTMPDIRWARRDIKTVQLLGQSMTKQAALDAGYKDAWMVDNDGFVTEASSSNAWIVKGKTLYTRRAGHSILKGVTRTAVSRVLEEQGLSWEEKAFSVEDAQNADEAFCSSATSLIVPVVEIDNKAIGDGKAGPVTKALLQGYVDYTQKGEGAQVSWKA